MGRRYFKGLFMKGKIPLSANQVAPTTNQFQMMRVNSTSIRVPYLFDSGLWYQISNIVNKSNVALHVNIDRVWFCDVLTNE